MEIHIDKQIGDKDWRNRLTDLREIGDTYWRDSLERQIEHRDLTDLRDEMDRQIRQTHWTDWTDQSSQIPYSVVYT